MPSLIAGVKGKLFIHSSRPSAHPLDGGFASLLRGRSLDFEDLREYEYGDELRDIDWRATARAGDLRVKRMRATRRHTVLFVVDTGREMAGLAPDEQPKRDLAVLAVGALGILSLRHGDDVAVVLGDASTAVRPRRLPPARTEAALEHLLRAVRDGVDGARAGNDREALLSFVARTVTTRMIVVVVTDSAPVTAETDRLLRRLRVQHDVLWLTLEDADPVRAEHRVAARADVRSGWRVPAFVQGDHEIVAELRAQRDVERARRDGLLLRHAVTQTTLDGQQTAVARLLRLLDRRAHARHL